MTAERKKAMLIMCITFVVGVITGGLATGFFAREHYHNEWGGRSSSERSGRGDSHRRERYSFSERIFWVTDADSSQQLRMKPILDETEKKIDQLQTDSWQRVRVLIDSMTVKLKPMLSAHQQEELMEYVTRHDKRTRGDDKDKSKDKGSEKEKHEKED
ncbi:MAG: hypothetical protein JST43_13795 [Bacteroidetes bacterium]|nr:hypothetical protein [Bacteroidota bacterium]MBS1539754.1 hypothetical protein [Bacteroidota bacterium]